jgi:hypothetical protein
MVENFKNSLSCAFLYGFKFLQHFVAKYIANKIIAVRISHVNLYGILRFLYGNFRFLLHDGIPAFNLPVRKLNVSYSV